jgi:hypothetical protein
VHSGRQERAKADLDDSLVKMTATTNFLHEVHVAKVKKSLHHETSSTFDPSNNLVHLVYCAIRYCEMKRESSLRSKYKDGVSLQIQECACDLVDGLDLAEASIYECESEGGERRGCLLTASE